MVANEYEHTSDYSKADLIFIDTCAYCKTEEDNSVRTIKRCFENKKREAKIVAIGCLPTINPIALRESGADHCISSGELFELDKLVQPERKYKSIPWGTNVMNFFSTFEERKLPEKNKKTAGEQSLHKLPGKYGYAGDNVYHVRVATGCLGGCSYCAIRFVWGSLKSRSTEDILKDVESAVHDGADEINLEAQDLGAYGLDIGTNIVNLLSGLFKVAGNCQLALNDFNPQWLIKFYPELKSIFAYNQNKISFINIPIQSASNRVLKLMNRPYRIEELRDVLIDLKKAAPSLWIVSDIMVGFPGETEEDFRETKEFVRYMKEQNILNYWFTPYSDRPNTAASRMDNKIGERIIEQRTSELVEIVGQIPTKKQSKVLKV